MCRRDTPAQGDVRLAPARPFSRSKQSFTLHLGSLRTSLGSPTDIDAGRFMLFRLNPMQFVRYGP